MYFELTAVSVFVLSFARTSAWLAASPLFTANGISSVGRLALAMALALFCTPIAMQGPPPPDDLYLFAAVLLGQVALGLVLGWVTGLALALFQSAGAIIDLTSGFSAAALLDPATGGQVAVVGRLFGMAFLALFFATNAHLVVARGFVRTFEATPPTTIPFFDADSVQMAAVSMSDLVLGALEMAAPLLGVLLLAEVALALTARFVPQANVFMIGLPLKLGIAIGLLGTTLVAFPVYAERSVESITRLMVGVGGG